MVEILHNKVHSQGLLGELVFSVQLGVGRLDAVEEAHSVLLVGEGEGCIETALQVEELLKEGVSRSASGTIKARDVAEDVEGALSVEDSEGALRCLPKRVRVAFQGVVLVSPVQESMLGLARGVENGVKHQASLEEPHRLLVCIIGGGEVRLHMLIVAQGSHITREGAGPVLVVRLILEEGNARSKGA